MINIGKFFDSLYRKFGSSDIETCRNEIRDIISTDFDKELFDELIEYKSIPSIEIIEFVASVLEADGQRDKAEWLRSKKSEIEVPKEYDVNFYWLNSDVKNEVMSMQSSKLKNLKRTIESVKENPLLLSGNHANIGFVLQGECLRDIKKVGVNGFRVYFVILYDEKSCVILGLSKGKSTTDVPREEILKYLNQASFYKNRINSSSLEEVNILVESIELNKGKIQNQTENIMKKFCPHCGKEVIKSDNPDYSWQCIDCDEDFYDFECSSEKIEESRKDRASAEDVKKFLDRTIPEMLKDNSGRSVAFDIGRCVYKGNSITVSAVVSWQDGYDDEENDFVDDDGYGLVVRLSEKNSDYFMDRWTYLSDSTLVDQPTEKLAKWLVDSFDELCEKGSVNESSDDDCVDLKISICTCNAAFEDGREDEIARILRVAADQIESGRKSFTLMDSNGNVVGKVELN